MALSFSIKRPSVASQPTLADVAVTPSRRHTEREKSEVKRPAPLHGGLAGRHPSLGTFLLDGAPIATEQLTAAIDQPRRTGRRIRRVLIDLGATTHDAVPGVNAHTIARVREGVTTLEEVVRLTQERS